jgi:hypothetical protein
VASTAELCDCRVDELEFHATVLGVVGHRHALHTHRTIGAVCLRTLYGMRLRTGDACV